VRVAVDDGFNWGFVSVEGLGDEVVAACSALNLASGHSVSGRISAQISDRIPNSQMSPGFDDLVR
jgi:hypothetical protein